MAIFHLRIDSPIPHITSGMTRFAGDLRSVKEPFEIAIEEVIVPRVKSNIDDETQADRKDWAALKDVTFQMPYRQEFGPGRGALEVTSTLYYAVTARDRWNIIGQGEESSAYATYPEFLPYAAPHEYGFVSPITGGWVPARPYFVINEADMADIETIFQDWLARQFGKTVATTEIIGRDTDLG